MIIKTRLTEKEFISASLATVWARKYSKIFLVLFSLFLVINLFSSFSRNDSVIPFIVPPILIFGLFFFVFRYSIKNAYKKNYRAGETIEYNFTDTHLLMTGESFTSEMTWNKIYRVTKTKNWLLVWHGSQSANAIPLSLIPSENINQLKVILQNNGTKNNL